MTVLLPFYYNLLKVIPKACANRQSFLALHLQIYEERRDLWKIFRQFRKTEYTSQQPSVAWQVRPYSVCEVICWLYRTAYRIIKSEGQLEYTPVPFFTEQLTAFELWLQHGSKEKNPPEQLPIVLQVGTAESLCPFLLSTALKSFWIVRVIRLFVVSFNFTIYSYSEVIMAAWFIAKYFNSAFWRGWSCLTWIWEVSIAESLVWYAHLEKLFADLKIRCDCNLSELSESCFTVILGKHQRLITCIYTFSNHTRSRLLHTDLPCKSWHVSIIWTSMLLKRRSCAGPT